MERLTYKVERKREGDWEKSYYTKHNKQELVDALAAYEDTGLTPEQIREIDRLYAEKCREVAELRQRDTEKEPQYEGDGYHDGDLICDTWICPNCGERYEVDYDDYDFCPKCGQRLKWEGTGDGQIDY